MRFQIVDLSVPLRHQASYEPLKPSIRYVGHEEGARMMQDMLGAQPADLPQGLGWAVEDVQANTHAGTHVDAPYHYHPWSEGRPARRIDEIPLEWCFAPAVVLDVRHLREGDEIGVADLSAALDRVEYRLKPNDIVLLHTACDLRLDTPEYYQQPGLARAGTLWLADQGVKIIGIDVYTLDRSFAAMKRDYAATRDAGHIWPAHFAGIEREYCQIEKLANLHLLPRPHGFWVSCLPVKIERASAAWCRAVALIPE